MSFQISQEDYQSFLNQALASDSQTQSYDQQNDALIEQGSEMVEQAKAAATDAAASLLPLGTIELTKAVGGLYEKGLKAFKYAKDIKAQVDAKTARVEKLKEDAYTKEVERAKSAGEEIPDKESFMNDIDATLREKQISSAIDTVKTAVINKVSPVIDEATNRVSNTIEALGATAQDGLTRLQTATEDTINTVADKFGQFQGLASKYQERYAEKFNKFKDATAEQIDDVSNKLSGRVDRTFAEFKDAEGNVAPELKAHFDAINDLVATKTPKSLIQADEMLRDVRSTIRASKGATQITNLKTQLDEAVLKKSQKISDLSEAHVNKINQLTSDKEALESKLNELNNNKPVENSVAGFEDLGATTSVFRGGVRMEIPRMVRTRGEELQGLQNKINSKNQAIQDEITSHSNNIQGIEEAHINAVSDIQNSIRNTTENVAKLAGEQTESILAKAKSAYTSVKDGITAVKETVAPITDVIGTALAPVAIYQGALSAEALVKGEGIGNATNDAQNLIGVKFGFDAAKGLTQKVVGKAQGLLAGEQEAEEEAKTAIEKTAASQVEETATKAGAETFAKSAGKMAGEDIAETIGKDVAEKGAEEGVAATIGGAIPVVGEVLDAGLALFSVIDGIKDLFDKPKPPPPPPTVSQAVAFTSQRGVY
jgi:hypothetical protein